jgi:hypothetical protein
VKTLSFFFLSTGYCPFPPPHKRFLTVWIGVFFGGKNFAFFFKLEKIQFQHIQRIFVGEKNGPQLLDFFLKLFYFKEEVSSFLQ